MNTTTIILIGGAGVVLFALARQRYLVARQERRESAILDFDFYKLLGWRFSQKRQSLSPEQRQKVFRALRQYFLICLDARGRFVSMPSQAVDDAWHEFILFTRNYEQFCRRAFGRMLHHTPAEAMSSPTLPTEGIRRAWRLACKREGIDPRKPDRLPLLFALDAELGIADGFRYSLDCERNPGSGYCAGDIGCGGGSCGGSGDSSASDGDGGGDGGGCGGGCGGGD
ncbi:hypothetical protein OPU71_07485 [Niveibacterium sp. 24ML]|uniref:glycine-rich domain-containing protein n=1 Tax=Niveibacterium sp. 24ML TaxID=2985512 RepID=UPI0022712989|nr:hypothetical protein [Niveibacterium sp. 24ML]MCX9155967.1 hypothetical protein [Niveibacterium sp. 24ML]